NSNEEPPLSSQGRVAPDEQQAAGRGAKYSGLTLRPTTRLLDHHKRPSRPLPR
ncbi:UNVERIFIED_CONTAM: hypothetical protein Sindi_2491800, partial [Sesamum indicum]